MSDQQFRVLSLGAGVQSSTLYLMAVEGECDWRVGARPDVAVFADTQWEPRDVYEHLERMAGVEWTSWVEVHDGREVERYRAIPGEYRGGAGGAVVPVVVVTQGDIRAAALATKITKNGHVNRVTTIPVYLRNPDGTGGMLKRQCTRDYKIRPIRRAVRALMQQRALPARAGAVEQWIGITTDEADRQKDSGVRYIVNRHPFLELGFDRGWCENWLAYRGVVAPKSACIGCPFSGDDRWRKLRADPSAWNDAVAFDASVRHLSEVNGEGYVHSSRKPLPLVQLTRRRSQQLGFSLFSNECEGMCGV